MSGESVLEIAADWVARHDELSDKEVKGLEAWLKSNEEHREVFDDLMAIYTSDELTSTLYDNRYSDTPATPEGGGVVHFFDKPTLKIGLAMAASIGLLAIVLPTQWGKQNNEKNQTISQNITLNNDSTDIGTIDGIDGSSVYLTPNTQASMQILEGERMVSLRQGRAYFDVSRDESKPFIVNVGDTKVTVLGTEFDIDYDGHDVELHVIEGSVQVFDSQSGITDTLVAGEQVEVTKTSFRRGNDPYLSWHDGWVVAQDTKVIELIKMLQVFSQDSIELDGDRIGEMTISGRFNVKDTYGSILILAGLLNLTVNQKVDRLIIAAQ